MHVMRLNSWVCLAKCFLQIQYDRCAFQNNAIILQEWLIASCQFCSTFNLIITCTHVANQTVLMLGTLLCLRELCYVGLFCLFLFHLSHSIFVFPVSCLLFPPKKRVKQLIKISTTTKVWGPWRANTNLFVYLQTQIPGTRPLLRSSISGWEHAFEPIPYHTD